MSSLGRKTKIVHGQAFDFDYPVCNRLGVPLEFIRRQIIVETVRDLHFEPLTLEEFLADPLHRYGRELVTGIDQDTGEPANIYREAVKSSKLPALRLGLHEEDGGGPLSFIPQFFPPTVEGRKLLERTIRDFRHREPEKWTGNPFTLAIFPEVTR